MDGFQFVEFISCAQCREIVEKCESSSLKVFLKERAKLPRCRGCARLEYKG